MGRHAVERLPFGARLFPRLHQFFDGKVSAFLPHLAKRTIRAGWGFGAVAAFSLVSIVDPYSGTMASADTISVYDPNTADEEQSYVHPDNLLRPWWLQYPYRQGCLVCEDCRVAIARLIKGICTA